VEIVPGSRGRERITDVDRCLSLRDVTHGTYANVGGNNEVLRCKSACRATALGKMFERRALGCDRQRVGQRLYGDRTGTEGTRLKAPLCLKFSAFRVLAWVRGTLPVWRPIKSFALDPISPR
jgi:hypothetical protein